MLRPCGGKELRQALELELSWGWGGWWHAEDEEGSVVFMGLVNDFGFYPKGTL